MTDDTTKRISASWRFLTYSLHFVQYCFLLRSVLGSHLAFVIFGGILFSSFENISIWQGIYFAIITATSVGYGDISPETLVGQVISIALALLGTIFFGLVIAVATRAFTDTIKDVIDVEGSSQRLHSSGK